MIKTLALLTSMGANVALLGLLLGTDSAATPARSPAGTGFAQTAQPQLAANSDGAYRRFLALGLSEHEAKALLFAELEAAATALTAKPSDRYWEPAPGALAEYTLAIAAAHGEVRRELERVFGARAQSEPAFARAFRPLEPQFAFLSSSEQVLLYESRLRNQLTLAAAPLESRFHTPGASQSWRSVTAPVPSDVLADATALEVELRDSALASQLRQSGLAFTEQEFRNTFALLREADSVSGIGAQLTVRRQLRAMLGSERFNLLSAGRDPVFASLRRVGRERGLDEATILGSYEILNEAQTRLLELAATGALDTDRAFTAVQDIAADEHRALIRLVGEAVAQAIIDARAEFFAAASRGSAPEAPRRDL